MAITKAELDDLIARAGHAYEPNKRAGLSVIQVRQGLYVQHLNETGVPIQLTTQQSNLLAETLSERLPGSVLARIFGYSETVRRKQGYLPRVSEKVGAAIDKGSIAYETLDGKAPLARADVPTARARAIPTAETYVRLGPPAMRVIRYREFSFPRIGGDSIRPDEIIVEYKITPAELEFVSRNPPMKLEEIRRELGGQIDAHELRIHSGDVNKPISDPDRIVHFKKTMDGGLAVLDLLLAKAGIRPVGQVLMTARDVYLGAPALLIRKASAGLVRWLPEGAGEKIVLNFKCYFAPDESGVWKAVGQPAVKLRNITNVLTSSTIRNNVAAVAIAIEKTLLQLARFVRR